MIKLITRCNILEGVNLILTYFFSMPKGTYNISMMSDATINGLENSL